MPSGVGLQPNPFRTTLTCPVSYQIGIGEGLTKRIGKGRSRREPVFLQTAHRVPDIGVLNFHRGNFRVSPFMKFDITVDWAQQAVSNNVTQFQPNYGKTVLASLLGVVLC